VPLVLALAWVILTPLWGAEGPDAASTSKGPSVSPAATIRIDNTPAGHHADWWATFAAQYDPFQWMCEGTSPPLGRRGMNESWWTIERERVKKFNLQGIRMWFQIDWWEPYNDNDDPHHFEPDFSGFAVDSPRMQAVYRFLDLCQEAGVEVGLNFGWKLGQPTRSWLGGGWGNTGAPPRPGRGGAVPPADAAPRLVPGSNHIRDAEEHAESLIALLKYLKQVRKYTCITQLTFGNEHEYNYPDMYPAALRRLREEGLRDGLIVWGIETNRDMKLNLPYVGVVDTFTVHIYRRGVDWEREVNSYYDMLGPHGSRKGTTRRVWLSEFAFGGDDRYDHGLFITDALIGNANAGAYAIGAWRLSDQHLPDNLRTADGRDKFNTGLHEWGIWRWIPWMQRPRDVYWAASLMTRYIPRWSAIHKPQIEGDLKATCFKKDDDYTLVVLNSASAARQITVDFREGVGRAFYRHLYSPETLPQGPYDTIIPSDRTFADGRITDTLPPQSMALYTTIADFPQVEVSPTVGSGAAGNPIAFSARAISAGPGPHQFDWSVEGGAVNGTIDANGLYTPPAGTPAIEPVVIRARLRNAPRQPAFDGLAVVMFEGVPMDRPARPEIVLHRGVDEARGSPGPRQIFLGNEVPVGSVIQRSFSMTNLSDRPAEYTISTSVPWLKVAPMWGQIAPKAPAVNVNLTVDTTGLAPGRGHIGYVIIDSPRGLGRDVIDVYFMTAR